MKPKLPIWFVGCALVGVSVSSAGAQPPADALPSEPPPTAAPQAEPETTPVQPSAPVPVSVEAPRTAEPNSQNAPLAGAADSMPETEWMPQVYRTVRSAIVQIKTAGKLATGFLFHSDRHVATSYRVVNRDRPITVAFADGTEAAAEVVATDSERDLAILELEQPVQEATPLELAPVGGAQVGAPIMVLGHPLGQRADFDDELEGLLNWSGMPGVLSAVTEDRLQLDVAVHPGQSGAPVLDRHGRLLGVVGSGQTAGRGLSIAVRAHRLATLTRRIRQQGSFAGTWLWEGELSYIGHFEPNGPLQGVQVAAGLVGFDQFGARLRLGFLWNTGNDPDDEPLLDRSHSRVLLELELDYRFMLGVIADMVPIYLSLGGGVSVFFDQIEESRLNLELDDPTCDLSTERCEVGAFTTRNDRNDTRVRPLLSATLHAGMFLVSYGFQADFDDVSDSTHRLLAGLRF